jgi:LmbE family N-acetylglucosaminyl deacetylase
VTSKLRILFISFVLFNIQLAHGQQPERYNSSDIQMMLQKLKVLGNVLYVAAHPDDENTSIITYFANERKVNTAYFSFTRGDGGQNLIGPEIRDELGVIRTNELQMARKIDNGRQFFSRAVDFGYSKHPDETFNIWEREKVLGDLVWVIRKFRPDVIITRFNTVPGTTHGHHTASAILSNEAMDIAGDPEKYKEQLTFVNPWQPQSLYWNAYFWRRSEYMKDTAELLNVDVGKYNELLGFSYSEISALSRSSHKSQGFGATGSRGQRLEYLQHEKGYMPESDIFEGIDITWARVQGGDGIDKKVQKIIEDFNPHHPDEIVGDLLNLRKEISELDDEFWKNQKLSEIDELIFAVTGLFLEVKAADFTATPGENIAVEIEAINRSKTRVTLEKVIFKELGVGNNYGIKLKNNSRENLSASIKLPSDIEYSQPYWLAKPHTLGMFQVNDQQLIGKPVNGATIKVDIVLNIDGNEIIYTKPIIYKTNDPVKGESYKPFYVIPPVFATISSDVIIFNNHESQKINVDLRAGKNNIKGKLKLNLPASWSVKPFEYDIELAQKNSEQKFVFDVKPPKEQEIAYAIPVVNIDGQEYSYEYSEIEYDHIPFQILFSKSESKFVKLDLKKGKERIGYIMGAGDNIPEILRQLGYEVDIINDLEYTPEILDEYETIIFGIRALNTVERLEFEMPQLFEYVERGGNLVIQYNTTSGLVTDNIAPYPLQISRDRVTVEEAEVKILNPDHELLNFPNKIVSSDFDGWVQERGLYFPNEWSEKFEPLLSSNDPGENPLKGGLLVANHGKGRYIYTGYSWFRELPAGVPGAYRIFINLITNPANRQ